MATRNCIGFVLGSLNALWKNLPERTGSNARLASVGGQMRLFCIPLETQEFPKWVVCVAALCSNSAVPTLWKV